MTSLSLFSSLIGILLYPYLIRVLGKNSYGLFVFALSITCFFAIFNKFGFGMPATKEIVENIDDKNTKNNILSAIFTAKILIFSILSIIFSVLCIFIPLFRDNVLIFSICYITLIADIIFPQWYFLAIQKMKFITIIQLFFRILTIPFIFIFVKKTENLLIYTIIYSTSLLFGGFAGMFVLWKKEGILPKIVSLKATKRHFRDALPFFWTSAASTLKMESITLIIGTFFSLADVALYDLANKIISIPRLLIMNVNTVLFPKVLVAKSKDMVKKIIRYETILGICVVALILIFGYWLVILFGGRDMAGAYPIAIVLSITVLTWLIIMAYINFIFIPQRKYYFVTKNQIVTFVAFFICTGIGLIFFKNIIVLAIALVLSGFVEIFYCKYLIKKHKLQ
jgi:PST family polysaccharide transporter